MNACNLQCNIYKYAMEWIFTKCNYWEKCNECKLLWKCMTMHYDAMTMIAVFPILPIGRYTRLVRYPGLRRRQAASIYGVSIQISSWGYTLGYLNQTLVSELLNLCVLGISRSNSSFHRPNCSSRNSSQTQTGGFTRPPKVVRARQTPKELHLQRI